MGQDMVEEIANKVADKVAERVLAQFSGSCRCGLQVERIKDHDAHHKFVGEVIDAINSGRRKALNLIFTAIILGGLGLLWLGFTAKIKQ